MTEDRFEQIKSGWSGAGYTDVDWLLKEVERLRKANEIMCAAFKLINEIDEPWGIADLESGFQKQKKIASEVPEKVSEVMSE